MCSPSLNIVQDDSFFAMTILVTNKNAQIPAATEVVVIKKSKPRSYRKNNEELDHWSGFVNSLQFKPIIFELSQPQTDLEPTDCQHKG